MDRLMKKGIWTIAVLLLSAACNADKEALAPDTTEPEDTAPVELAFEAAVRESLTFKVGDTIIFSLRGNAEVVSFYSGTVGNNYEYRDEDRFYDVKALLSFESNKTPANSTNIDCAELLYTTDFDGNYDYDHVRTIDWKPITDRVALQTELQATANEYLDSGEADISDLFEEGKPVYLAWLTKTEAASYRTQFRVRNFTISSVVTDDESLSTVLYTQAGADFHWSLNADAAAQASNLPTVTSTLLTWNGIFNNTTGPYKEGYAISAALELPQFNAGKDKPQMLFPKNDNSWGTKEFVYDKPGIYEVVFVASRTGDQTEIVKKIKIIIEEADVAEE